MGAVDRIVAELNQELYSTILNYNIRGAARNVIGVNQPVNWATYKVQLMKNKRN